MFRHRTWLLDSQTHHRVGGIMPLIPERPSLSIGRELFRI